QQDGLAAPVLQQAKGQLDLGPAGVQPPVAQRPLAPPAGAGGGGGGGHVVGELAGLAAAGAGQGEAEVGQGVGLVAVQAGEQLGGNGAAPVAYNDSSTHGSLRNSLCQHDVTVQSSGP